MTQNSITDMYMPVAIPYSLKSELEAWLQSRGLTIGPKRKSPVTNEEYHYIVPSLTSYPNFPA